MATNVRFIGWEAEGLRCPDHELTFGDVETEHWPSVNLVQMPNGTGKTTTLSLLRTALSGRGIDGEAEAEAVQSYRKNEAVGSGHFAVHLAVNGKRCTIRLNFDFDAGEVSYSTTQKSGMKRGFHPPVALKPFVRSGFVKFFVFHGELAEDLISQGETDAQRAIDDLFHLNWFSDVGRRLDEYWEQKVANRSAKTERGFTRRKNRVENLKERLERLEDERNDLERELDDVEGRLSDLNKRFSDALDEHEEHRENVAEARAALERAQGELNTTKEEIVDLIKNPCTFSSAVSRRLQNFKESLDKAKLPESAAEEFFVELADQPKCVCGRVHTEETRTAVRERAGEYLGSDNVALLNAIKTRISDAYGDRPERYSERLEDKVEELRKRLSNVARKRTERDAVEADAAAGRPDVEYVKEEIEDLRDQRNRLEHRLRVFEDENASGPDDDVSSIPVLRKRLTEEREKLATITDTLEFKAKRDCLESVLQDALEMSRTALNAEICRQTNERIGELIPDNPVRVDEIRESLELAGQRSGSTGENLSVAYAFLSTLFSRSNHTLPFVVDSPANPIDLEVRREVGRLVPKLADQFIAFTISSERAGFLEPLEESAPEVRYITMFNKGNPKVEWQDEGKSVQETEDGVVITGRDFFVDFQVDEEVN